MSSNDDDTQTQAVSAVQPDDAGESGEMPPVEQVELDDVLRRHSRRRRAAGIGVLGIAALLAAVLVTHAALAARPAAVATPIPVSHRPVGVALVSNSSFGTLTLNGRQLEGPPPQAVALRNGTNAIELAAPPFATRHCSITWPALAVLGGRCTVGVSYVPQQINPALDVEYLITLDFDGRDLPPDAAASARAALDAGIGAARLQTTVPSGQRIAVGWTPQTGAIASRSVAQPAQAQLSFAPAATSDCPNGLCAGPDFIPGFSGQEPPGGPAWMLSMGVSYTWRFSTQSGAPMATVTYPSDAPADIALVPNRDGSGWHIWQPAPQATAAASAPQSALAGTVCDWASVFRVALPGVPSPTFVSVQVGPGIEGCEFDLQGLDGAPAGTLVWRFGVLLAADDLAHARFPALPLAPPGALVAVRGG